MLNGARRLHTLNERGKKKKKKTVCEGCHTRRRHIVDVSTHHSARKPFTKLVLTSFQMTVPSLDVMADQGRDPHDDISKCLAGGGIVN
jgi:hypothetical protein